MERRRIFVVEDDERNIEAAREDLKDHELEIATTYIEAVKRLELFNVLSKKDSFRPLDILITDLYIPYSKVSPISCPAQKHWDGNPRPFGYNLILLGVARKIPFIFLLSDRNHHQSLEAAALDQLDIADHKGLLRIGESVIHANLRNFADPEYTRGLPKRYGLLLEYSEGEISKGQSKPS